MSITGASPLVTSWMELGLDWAFLWRPTLRPFTIPAGGQTQIPSEEYTFTAPEGILRNFVAGFDHPLCGIRYEANPELDTGSDFTVAQLAAVGVQNFPIYITALIPPRTPPGVYMVSQSKEWEWEEWARLYVINTDTLPHRCLFYGYTMIVLKEPRPGDTLIPPQTLKTMQLIYEMYPEKREKLREKFSETFDAWVEKLNYDKLARVGA